MIVVALLPLIQLTVNALNAGLLSYESAFVEFFNLSRESITPQHCAKVGNHVLPSTHTESVPCLVFLCHVDSFGTLSLPIHIYSCDFLLSHMGLVSIYSLCSMDIVVWKLLMSTESRRVYGIP